MAQDTQMTDNSSHSNTYYPNQPNPYKSNNKNSNNDNINAQEHVGYYTLRKLEDMRNKADQFNHYEMWLQICDVLEQAQRYPLPHIYHKNPALANILLEIDHTLQSNLENDLKEEKKSNDFSSMSTNALDNIFNGNTSQRNRVSESPNVRNIRTGVQLLSISNDINRDYFKIRVTKSTDDAVYPRGQEIFLEINVENIGLKPFETIGSKDDDIQVAINTGDTWPWPVKWMTFGPIEPGKSAVVYVSTKAVSEGTYVFSRSLMKYSHPIGNEIIQKITVVPPVSVRLLSMEIPPKVNGNEQINIKITVKNTGGKSLDPNVHEITKTVQNKWNPPIACTIPIIKPNEIGVVQIDTIAPNADQTYMMMIRFRLISGQEFRSDEMVLPINVISAQSVEQNNMNNMSSLSNMAHSSGVRGVGDCNGWNVNSGGTVNFCPTFQGGNANSNNNR